LGLYGIIILLVLFIIFYRIEKINHEKNIKLIPVRIWVNGTRGKSSVTRLIAAGLRAGGKKVIAKTTGTRPRFIIKNRLEIPVLRLGTANIREQMSIFKKAAKQKPKAVVLECMAIRPDLQWTESIQIVKPTAVVITNVRPDHLDVMGPTTEDVAKAFINAIPQNCCLFITKSDIYNNFLKGLRKKTVEVFTSNAENISADEIKNFSYIEHKENVALSLDVCMHFGVNREIALKGMYEANPDPGALKKYKIYLNNKEISLINAMAANDPVSTYLIWQSIDKKIFEINLLVNCRDDRIDRSFQLARLIKEKLKAERYILTGSGTKILAHKIYKLIDKEKVLNLGGKKPEQVVNEVARFVGNRSLIFAIGNTVGYGEEMLEEFLKHKVQNVN